MVTLRTMIWKMTKTMTMVTKAIMMKDNTGYRVNDKGNNNNNNIAGSKDDDDSNKY